MVTRCARRFSQALGVGLLAQSLWLHLAWQLYIYIYRGRHCQTTMAAIKRGSSLCEGCGVSNGNRAVTCKGCNEVLTTKTKRPKSDLVAHHSSNVTLLLDEESRKEVASAYSTRIRPQGPDYRCFVTKGIDGAWKCTNKECEVARQGRARSGKHGPK